MRRWLVLLMPCWLGCSEAASVAPVTNETGTESRDGGNVEDANTDTGRVAAEVGPQCAADGRAPAWAPGEVLVGEGGTRVELVDAAPAPRIGKSDWTLRVSDAAGAVAGATVRVEPYMPDHGHGSPLAPKVREVAAGTYEATGVSFTMAGYWETTVEVDRAGVVDRVKFRHCVE